MVHHSVGAVAPRSAHALAAACQAVAAQLVVPDRGRRGGVEAEPLAADRLEDVGRREPAAGPKRGGEGEPCYRKTGAEIYYSWTAIDHESWYGC